MGALVWGVGTEALLVPTAEHVASRWPAWDVLISCMGPVGPPKGGAQPAGPIIQPGRPRWLRYPGPRATVRHRATALPICEATMTRPATRPLRVHPLEDRCTPAVV